MRNRRLITACWFVISYLSFFAIFLAMGGPFKQYRGFTGDYVYIKDDTIFICIVYMLVFNMAFAAAESLTWRVFSPQKINTFAWSLPKGDSISEISRVIFGLILTASVVLYGIKMHGLGYRGYVEYQESDWSVVFFWASSPFITFSAMRKKYLQAFLGTIPFLYFAFTLHIRSFALASIIPVALIVFFQTFTGPNAKVRRKSIIVGAAFLSVLIVISSVIMYLKTGRADLPDSGLPYGMAITFQKTIELNKYTGWNSLHLYLINILKPVYKLFYKLFGIDLPDIVDTPTYIAWLVDGVPLTSKIFFHYPTTWYSDAFVSFGYAGILLGLLWGVVLSLMELVMSRSAHFFGLFLPYYAWHAYMLCRGATAIAAVPISYPFYISAAIFFFASLFVHRPPVKYRYENT
ncbi:MAG: hypothetical protein M0Z61_14305 [Nitrospiraceae bacterium]|nr:hypothetical protein [Nitrospiraceae bacterium]